MKIFQLATCFSKVFSSSLSSLNVKCSLRVQFLFSRFFCYSSAFILSSSIFILFLQLFLFCSAFNLFFSLLSSLINSFDIIFSISNCGYNSCICPSKLSTYKDIPASSCLGGIGSSAKLLLEASD